MPISHLYDLQEIIDNERNRTKMKRFVNDTCLGPYLLIGISRELVNDTSLISEKTDDTYYLVHENISFRDGEYCLVKRSKNIHRLVYDLSQYAFDMHDLYLETANETEFDDSDIEEYSQFSDPSLQRMVIYFSKNMFECLHPREKFRFRSTKKRFPSKKYEILCSWKSCEFRYGIGDIYYLVKKRQNSEKL